MDARLDQLHCELEYLGEVERQGGCGRANLVDGHFMRACLIIATMRSC